jgi:uncharacterized protein YcbK (DUF882 family)
MPDTEMLSPNFSRSELACKHCGECEIKQEIVDVIQRIRIGLGKPMFISSGYRCPQHPVEAMKDKNPLSPPGAHVDGYAVDIICHGRVALKVIEMAQSLGVTRIGIFQRGRASGRYIHIDVADKHDDRYPSGVIWTY